MSGSESELSEIKTQLAVLTEAVGRMERHMQSYTVLDKDVSIIQLQQTHIADAITSMRERVDQNASASVQADGIIHKRIDDLVKEHSTFSNRATGGFYVVCVMGTIVVALCTWALVQITNNIGTNIEQNQRLNTVERQLNIKGGN